KHRGAGGSPPSGRSTDARPPAGHAPRLDKHPLARHPCKLLHKGYVMATVLILMPTGGQIDTPAVHSLLGLTQALSKRGVAFALKTYEWSDLVISRNYLMS